MPHSTGAAVRCEETSRGGQDRQRETKHQMRERDQGKGQGHRAKVERTGDNNKKQEKQTIGAASKNKEARWARGEGSKRTADRIQVTSGQRSKRYSGDAEHEAGGRAGSNRGRVTGAWHRRKTGQERES